MPEKRAAKKRAPLTELTSAILLLPKNELSIR